jgi:hypothetical protein
MLIQIGYIKSRTVGRQSRSIWRATDVEKTDDVICTRVEPGDCAIAKIGYVRYHLGVRGRAVGDEEPAKKDENKSEVA